jgi:hypothetical protein
MLTVKDILTDKVTLDIECVDHVLLNGYVKYLQMPGGLITFIREQMGFPIPSPIVLPPVTKAFREAVEKFAVAQGLAIVDFAHDEDKDETARAHLAKFDKKSGVVLIGKAQEKTQGYTARRKDHGKKVWFEYSRRAVWVTHYYFYILDEDFGLFFIKVCTYFPFDVKVCFNGHEWAKQQLRKEGIGFEALSNGFRSCENSVRLQALCHQLNAEKIQALFDGWVAQLPWPLTAAQQAAGYRHQLSLWQMEVSRTQVFADPEQGWALVEALIRDNLDLGRPDRVSLIFERKVTKRTPGEFYTRVVREGVQPTMRIHYKHSALKQYLKDGRGLRTEMMFNNTQDFGLSRGLQNFARLFEMGRNFNLRLLEQEQISEDCFVPLHDLRQLGQSTLMDNGQRASALRFGDPRTMALLEALACHAYIPAEITSRTLRPVAAQLIGAAPDAYSSAQMTYDLRRLRLKGLIERVAHSHRYRLTSLGLKVVTFFTKLYQRVFRPGLAAMAPHPASPSELAKALESVVEIIQSWTDQAFSVPVTGVA